MERSSTICPTTGLNKGPWSAEEDAKLRDYVNHHGVPTRWSQVPAEAGLSRCRKSCRFRWKNYLDPITERGNYTKEEDNLIIHLHGLGLGWAEIAKWLPRRTDCDIKNHWYTKLNKDPKPIKEKRKQGGPGGSKRVRVDPNNTTPVVLESSENHCIGENSTQVILESSALPLVSSTKSLPSWSTQNSEGSASSPTPNSGDKNALVLKEALEDWDIPSKNPDDLVDPSLFGNDTSSLLQQGWDFPIENELELVQPEFTLFTPLNGRPQRMSIFTSPDIMRSSDDHRVPLLSPTLSSPVILESSADPSVSRTRSSWICRGNYSVISGTENFHHISPEEFSELTSPDEFSEEETSKFNSQEEISESTSPQKFSCFTCMTSFVSLLQDSLNYLVSLCNFKKRN